jgi:hypothetical protein
MAAPIGTGPWKAPTPPEPRSVIGTEAGDRPYLCLKKRGHFPIIVLSTLSMENTDVLHAGLNDNTQILLSWTDGLTAEQFGLRPGPDKWNVMEVLEHCFVVEKGAARLSRMDCEPVERDLVARKAFMWNGMADMNQPFSGGSAIDPKGRFSSYDEWRAAFIANRAELLQLGAEKGWMGLCTGFPHPFYGHLTRAEWVIFVGQHVDRHLMQMQTYVK